VAKADIFFIYCPRPEGRGYSIKKFFPHLTSHQQTCSSAQKDWSWLSFSGSAFQQ